ncbi:MAG TPA: hypothetical protein VFE62_19130 [Gemmataceae bacterium]|nr:hypothetical protein [Gemmataceae bacterium]
MDSASANNTPAPDPGLPPVRPPSGRFIAQLFVIPALIILVVVLLFLGFAVFVRNSREPEYFLAQLDSDNHDIRWRGMNDLAQILKRTEPAALRWKTDVNFGFELADRLDKTFHELIVDEKRIGDEIANSTDKDKHLLWRKLREKRDYAGFLAGALGEMQIPVGAPVLCDIIRHDDSPDVNGNTMRRRQAIWALMNMGENMKGFAKLPDERRKEIVTALTEESQLSGNRGKWAQTTLYYVDRSALPTGASPNIVRVDETLAVAADAEDQYLRQLTAMAFTYWDGELAVPTLLKLCNDRGQGSVLRVEEKD